MVKSWCVVFIILIFIDRIRFVYKCLCFLRLLYEFLDWCYDVDNDCF